jgi:hypothetical protein
MAAQSLIESARRRLHIQILSSQALVALSIGAAGLVLLLILGTQVMDWYWPILLGLCAFGYLVFRVWNRLPNSYRSAQILDHRLNTYDLFSTAHHFSTQPRTPLTDNLIAAADSAATQYSAADAIPFQMPSGWARAAALATVALSLLVFRYAFQSSLDLGSPIAPGMYQLLASGEKPKQLAKNKQTPDGQPMEGFGLTDATQQRPDDKAMEKSQDVNAESASATESAAGGQKPGQFQQSMSPSEEGEKMEGTEKGDQSSPGEKNSKGDDGKKDGDKQGGNPADKKSGGQQNQANQQGDKNSLMDKFKDAMANMMNKLKSQDKSEGQQQQAQNKQDGQQGNGQQQQQAQKGQQAQGKQQAGGQQQNDPNGQQQGDGNEKSPNQQAKGGDKSNQPSSGDQKSGTGKQDGSKDIQLAEQQRAMGKISEVFGKRAQNLQGEIMIEVTSSKSQALKTNYSDKSATHSDTAGVIRRDEVPLIFQNYVQKYFEELRKSPPPTPKSNP